MKILIISLTSLFVFGGCTLLPKTPVQVKTIAKPAPLYHPPLLSEIEILPINWKVVTPELMEEYLELFKKGEAPAVPYYSLTTQQYENLSSNVADITRYIENILSIIKYYRSLDEEKQKDGGAE